MRDEHDHLVDRIDALDRLVQVEIRSIRREMGTYTSMAERSLNAHNDIIEQMRQQAAHYATKEVVDLNREGYLKRFEGIERFQSRVTGALVLVAVGMPLFTLLIDRVLSRR